MTLYCYPGADIFPSSTQYPGPQATFFPPIQSLPYFLEGRLRAWEQRGLSVWRLDGVWHEGSSPSAAIRASADRFYLGGIAHPLTTAEQADLIAAGYGSYITTREVK